MLPLVSWMSAGARRRGLRNRRNEVFRVENSDRFVGRRECRQCAIGDKRSCVESSGRHPQGFEEGALVGQAERQTYRNRYRAEPPRTEQVRDREIHFGNDQQHIVAAANSRGRETGRDRLRALTQRRPRPRGPAAILPETERRPLRPRVGSSAQQLGHGPGHASDHGILQSPTSVFGRPFVARIMYSSAVRRAKLSRAIVMYD